jgi:hypothetical protein
MAKSNKKPYNKGKQGKTNKPEQSKQASAENTTAVTAASALLETAANVSFPVTAGYPIRLGNHSHSFVDTTGLAPLRIPGIMRFGYIPTFGDLKNWVSPANVWLRDWYTFVRHANSGHSNYNAPDLGFYGLAYRSCEDYLYWMHRVYGVAMGSYVPANAYTPGDLVRACGADYDDIIVNMAQLRFYIASYAARLKQLKVPAFKFFTQGKELLSNIYADTDNGKASFYVFDPDAFWYFDLADTPELTAMRLLHKPEMMTFEQIREMGETILNALLNNEDFNIMSGDIMKAYSDYAAVTVIDEDFTVVPVYDRDVLWAIHNANYLYAGDEVTPEGEKFLDLFVDSCSVSQNMTEDPTVSNCLQFWNEVYFNDDIYTPNWLDGHLGLLTQDFVIDLPNDQPSAAAVGLVTRFKLGITPRMEKEGLFGTLDSVQSEIITTAQMITEPRGPFVPVNYSNLSAVAKFDYHPFISSASGRSDGVALFVSSNGDPYVGDVTNITAMTRATKANIDMAQMLDLFVPKV